MENDFIFKFLIDCLKTANAPYNVINGELIMAQCQVQVPRTFFTPARVENLNLQLVTDPGLLKKYPGAELVVKNSYRLQWFCDGIKERGKITRLTVFYELDPRRIQREIMALLPAPPAFFFEQPNIIYQPHLLVNFKVSFETDEKTEELHSLGINLVNGNITTRFMEMLTGKKVSPHPPKKNLEKRKIPYSEAFNALSSHLKWQLQIRDHQWAESAKGRWEEEVTYLENYYDGDDEDHDPGGFYRRMAEVYRKFRPVIKIQIANAGQIFLPLVTYTLESLDGAPLPPLVYDPFRHKILTQVPVMVKDNGGNDQPGGLGPQNPRA